jgi:hypothetical protein
MTYEEYFATVTYKATYHLGDRVLGRYEGIPFIGTVGNDKQLNETDGPFITVHLDLPIKIDDIVKNVIIVKHEQINRLKEFALEAHTGRAEDSKPSRSGFDSHVAHQKPKKVIKEVTKTESLLDRLKTLKGKTNVSNTKKSGKRISR